MGVGSKAGLTLLYVVILIIFINYIVKNPGVPCWNDSAILFVPSKFKTCDPNISFHKVLISNIF